METYTSQADNLHRQANEVECPVYISPYTSCYEALWANYKLVPQAREMESAARDIRKQFQEIAASGLSIPSSTLLRKAVISVKRGKFMFSTDQITKMVQVLMENFPYILFRAKSDNKEYVILLFWSTDTDDSACQVQKKFEIVKQKIAVDLFQMRCIVENVPAPRRQFLYLLNNYICLKMQNDNGFHLSPENQEQLESFLKLLNNPEPSKKRKAVDFVSTFCCIFCFLLYNVIINCE